MAQEQPASAAEHRMEIWVANLTSAVKEVAKTVENQRERGLREWLRVGESVCQIVLFPAAIAAGLISFFEYRDHRDREHREAAERAYDRADANYTEFLRTCVEHPELDCYSATSFGAIHGKDDAETARLQLQQRVMFTMLVDVFEVAYVNYNNKGYVEDAHDAYCRQWPAWVVELRNYLRKDAFRATWSAVGKDFDSDFQACVSVLLDENKATALDAPPPPKCVVTSCPAPRNADSGGTAQVVP